MNILQSPNVYLIVSIAEKRKIAIYLSLFKGSFKLKLKFFLNLLMIKLESKKFIVNFFRSQKSI